MSKKKKFDPQISDQLLEAIRWKTCDSCSLTLEDFDPQYKFDAWLLEWWPRENLKPIEEAPDAE
jgi:hypothetical protein